MQSLYEYRKFYMFIPLELTLRPSRIYPALLALAHGLALAGIWLASLPPWIKVLAVFALIGGAAWLWRESRNSARGMRVSQSGQIELLGEGWQPVRVKGCPVVLPWLVSFMLEHEDGRQARLMLWPDSTEADLFRKLRVWLRWGYRSAHLG